MGELTIKFYDENSILARDAALRAESAAVDAATDAVAAVDVVVDAAVAAAVAEIEALNVSALISADRAEAAANLLGATYTPASNGYALVLDPGNPATVYSDISGTTLAVVGGPVGKILDVSGSTRHWTAYDNASRPTYRRTADGRYYVEFDGVDDWGMCVAFASPIAQPFTRLSLIRQISWSSNDHIFDGGVSAEVRLVQQSSSPLLAIHASAPNALNGDSVIGQDTVVEEYYSGASSFLRQENYMQVVANPGANSLYQLRIGGIWFGSQTASANFGNFRLYGVAIIAGAQTGADRLANRNSFYRRRRSYLATPKIIQMIGHSFVAGTGASTEANRYVNRLATRLGSAYATVNRGIPTQQSHNIACRMDALPMTVTLTGNAIPASGGVGLTMVSPLATTFSGSQQAQSGQLANLANTSLPVTITTTNGTVVEGMMSVAGTQGVYTFTRTAAGEPLTVAVGATMHVLQNDRDYNLTIIDACRNNFREVARVQSDIAAMVASLKPGSDYIIIGCTNSRGGTEDTGSAALTDMLALNAALLSTYGASRFFDAYAYLRNTGAGGAYVALSKSSAGDAADLAAGRIGATWLAPGPDNLHPNNDGHDAYSFKLNAMAAALGW